MIQSHEHDHSLCPDARRHLARPVLPARLAARGRRGPRPGADRRHRRLGPAAARRRGRGQHLDQQGRDRVALDRAGMRRRLPVRPGRRRPEVGRYPAELRQHARRRRSVRHRAGFDRREGRGDDRARLQRQHQVAHRCHGAHAGRAGHLRRRRAHRRRGRHGGADPPELPRCLGRGHRVGIPHRAAHRRHRRHRAHLHRRGHAADDRARSRPGRERPREPGRARRERVLLQRSNRCAAPRAR